MTKQLAQKQRNFLDRWIKAIIKDKRNSELAVKKHINHHAKEIYTSDPVKWSASMRNLVEMYEAIRKIKPSTKSQIERFQNKYNKNPKRYTPPPTK